MRSSSLFSLFFVALAATSALAGPAEDRTLLRLVLTEQTFFGIDADVRRLLNDPVFEADVRRWFQAVSPSYVEEALQGGPADDPHPETDELRRWAAQSGLKANNATQLRMRQLLAEHFMSGLPSEKARMYLAYFLLTGQAGKAQSLLKIYALEFALFAGEYAEDPRHAGLRETGIALGITEKLLAGPERETHAAIDAYAACASRFSGIESLKEVGNCLGAAIQFKIPLEYRGPMHVVSRTGFIPGNDVAYFTDNRHDSRIVKELEAMYLGEKDPVKETFGRMTLEQFVDTLRQGGTPFAGLPLVYAATHPALGVGPALDPRVAIFPELIRGIQAAKHTLFVDIFFLGGTMGAAMSRELIAASERGVKVLLLHDPYNAFDYVGEMAPVFKAMLAYSQLHPDKITVAGSYIMAHRTGLPAYFDALIPDSLVDSLMTGARKLFRFSLPLFPKAKSDHSKVMVVDGAGLWPDSTPIAYVGSKNWTDSSGAMTFDEVARVQGPAAVVVQDSYYWDMWYALRSGAGGRKAMQSAEIERALEPFDALGRRWDAGGKRVVPTRKQLVNVGERAGGITVRFGENNFDGSVMSALDQDIYAIRAATKQIVINDQFLYDRRIIGELLDKARADKGVQIYIMLEPISKTSGLNSEVLGGFPNTLYLDLLKYEAIELDAAGNPKPGPAWPNIHVRWKHIPHSEEFHLEYHMKTISVDGFDGQGRRVPADGPAILITGSANKDHMTMTGAFREAQVEIFDSRPCSNAGCGAVAEADRMFWKRWSNQATEDEGGGSEDADPFRFTVPPQIQSVAKPALGRDMTSAEFLMFTGGLIHKAYDLERSATVE